MGSAAAELRLEYTLLHVLLATAGMESWLWSDAFEWVHYTGGHLDSEYFNIRDEVNNRADFHKN